MVKGMLRRYIGKMTGLSRAQVTRLIGRYQEGGAVRERNYRRNRFSNRYTAADIELLAAVDEAHEMMSGPATHKKHRTFSGKVCDGFSFGDRQGVLRKLLVVA